MAHTYAVTTSNEMAADSGCTTGCTAGPSISALDMLRTLLQLNARASNLAKVIRAEPELFRLLVQEKSGSDRNAKFAHDFKTLADVLIQEMVRFEIETKLPALRDSVFGEESNRFTSTSSGETVVLRVEDRDEAALATTLARVLPLSASSSAAELLAHAVFDDSGFSGDESEIEEAENKLDKIMLPLPELGIWVDPIDGTNVYIQSTGQETELSDLAICEAGLQCVSVILGLFNKNTGEPVLGVIGQPFHQRTSVDDWSTRVLWGCSTANTAVCSKILRNTHIDEKSRTPVAVFSRFEIDTDLRELSRALSAAGWRVITTTGAGYKALCVALGLADIYIFRGSTTYWWDTCGPQALVRALGGDIVDMAQAWNVLRHSPNTNFKDIPHSDLRSLLHPLEYSTRRRLYTSFDTTEISRYANIGGLVCYRSVERLAELLEIARTSAAL